MIALDAWIAAGRLVRRTWGFVGVVAWMIDRRCSRGPGVVCGASMQRGMYCAEEDVL